MLATYMRPAVGGEPQPVVVHAVLLEDLARVRRVGHVDGGRGSARPSWSRRRSSRPATSPTRGRAGPRASRRAAAGAGSPVARRRCRAVPAAANALPVTAASSPRPWCTSRDSCGLSIAGLTSVVVFAGLLRVGHVDDDHAEPVARLHEHVGREQPGRVVEGADVAGVVLVAQHLEAAGALARARPAWRCTRSPWRRGRWRSPRPAPGPGCRSPGWLPRLHVAGGVAAGNESPLAEARRTATARAARRAAPPPPPPGGGALRSRHSLTSGTTPACRRPRRTPRPATAITSATGRTSFIRPTIWPIGIEITSGSLEALIRLWASATSRFCSGIGSGSGAPSSAQASVHLVLSSRAGLPV